MANQKKDEWVREWTVYSSAGSGGGKIGKGRFTLVAATGSYTVGTNVGLPDDPWKTLVFYPHGELDPAFKTGPLNPWDQANDSAWNRAATGVREAAGLATKRLEGTFPGHDVILLRCDAAVTDGTPMLVVQLVPIKSDVLPPGRILQDGTGHGGHPP